MHILELNQNGVETQIGVFDSIEEGRKFISKLKGYPLTKFIFVENGRIDIIWKEIPNLSKAYYIEKSILKIGIF